MPNYNKTNRTNTLMECLTKLDMSRRAVDMWRTRQPTAVNLFLAQLEEDTKKKTTKPSWNATSKVHRIERL